MPYKLRKAPKRDLYWVVGEDGTKHSKEPLPKERAEAQRRALYVAMKKEMKGGDIKDEWANRVPQTEAAWTKRHPTGDYVRDYLTPFQDASRRMSSRVPVAAECPPGSTQIYKQSDTATLPPGTRWCLKNPDGSLSSGQTDSVERSAALAADNQQMADIRKNNQKIAEDKYYEEHPTSKFFNKTLMGAITGVGDIGAEILDKALPGAKPLTGLYRGLRQSTGGGHDLERLIGGILPPPKKKSLRTLLANSNRSG